MQQILAFLQEADRLKGVLRKTKVVCEDRLENSAEHSWHLALMAMVLAPYAKDPVDLGKVIPMLIVHDLVEIDAGDVIVYDKVAQAEKREKEEAAANRLFGMLGEEGVTLRDLWEEFEAQQTPESRFAAALDRIQPILSNLACEGHSWQTHGITHDLVLEKNGFVGEVIPELWPIIESQLDLAVEKGILKAPAGVPEK